VPRAKRGEIWIADLGLAAKVRPVLVLSVAYEGQERAIVSYVIRTTSLRDTRYEVRHETHGMPNGAFDAQGLGSIPEIKLERRVGLVDSETVTPQPSQVCFESFPEAVRIRVARYPLVEIGDSKTGIRFLLWDGTRVGRNGSPR
jgi:mRNA interferase MazF